MQKFKTYLIAVVAFLLAMPVCAATKTQKVITGAEQTKAYLKQLKGKRVALFSNQTGVVGNKHLLDVLLENKVNVVTIFSPEHGFRGKADAGEKVSSSIDEQTGVPIYSLYGVKGGAPDDAEMQKFDVLLSDIQDVGLRFYTYYITMQRLMDRCAEFGKKMIVLDRPNPNGMYVDGPILDMKYKSGVGSLPIPVVHGLTLGELALMINGEGWLKEGRKCNLTVVPCKGYTHQTRYKLPVIPSPNLPNMTSIYLYPSLCYFEATNVSLGRGTDKPLHASGQPAGFGPLVRRGEELQLGPQRPGRAQQAALPPALQKVLGHVQHVLAGAVAPAQPVHRKLRPAGPQRSLALARGPAKAVDGLIRVADAEKALAAGRQQGADHGQLHG